MYLQLYQPYGGAPKRPRCERNGYNSVEKRSRENLAYVIVVGTDVPKIGPVTAIKTTDLLRSAVAPFCRNPYSTSSQGVEKQGVENTHVDLFALTVIPNIQGSSAILRDSLVRRWYDEKLPDLPWGEQGG